jgi:hypothetical protein
MLAVVSEGPLQVYKKKNEVTEVSKEPKRKLKVCASCISVVMLSCSRELLLGSI